MDDETTGKTVIGLNSSDRPNYLSPVKLKQRPRIRAIAIEGYGEPRDNYSNRENELKDWLEKARNSSSSIKRTGPPFGVYYTSRLKAGVEHVVWDACLPLNREVHPQGKIKYQLLPATEVASVTLTGSYELIGDALQHLERVVQDHSRRVAWPLTEFYLKEGETPITELQFFLAHE